MVGVVYHRTRQVTLFSLTARAFSTGARAGASAGFRTMSKVAAVGAVGVAAYAYSQSKCVL